MKDPKKSESHFYLGRAFQKKKMFDMADKQFAQSEVDVISQDRKLEILYYRAICCAEAAKKDKAIELGNKIIEIDINYRDIAELVEKWGAAPPASGRPRPPPGRRGKPARPGRRDQAARNRLDSPPAF